MNINSISRGLSSTTSGTTLRHLPAPTIPVFEKPTPNIYLIILEQRFEIPASGNRWENVLRNGLERN
jgi:hypothetical protein